MHAAARHAVAAGDVTGLVHRDRAHPAVLGIRRKRALLVHTERPAGRRRLAELVPAHSDAAPRGDGMIDDQRLVVTEVAIGEPVHQPVPERVELLARSRLRNARPAPARLAEGVDRDRGRPREGRVPRAGEVHAELVEMERVGDDVDKGIGSAVGRRRRSVEVRRQQAVHAGAILKADRGGGAARQHRVPIERADERAEKGRARRIEGVERHVVAVRPHSQLRIVREVIVGNRERVPAVAAGGVRGSRDGHAIHERRAVHRLRHHPAAGRLVELRDDVAAVVRLARPAEPRPETVAGGRAEEQMARRLVIHGVPDVHPLDVLRGARRPVGIRRGVPVRAHPGKRRAVVLPPRGRDGLEPGIRRRGSRGVFRLRVEEGDHAGRPRPRPARGRRNHFAQGRRQIVLDLVDDLRHWLNVLGRGAKSRPGPQAQRHERADQHARPSSRHGIPHVASSPPGHSTSHEMRSGHPSPTAPSST